MGSVGLFSVMLLFQIFKLGHLGRLWFSWISFFNFKIIGIPTSGHPALWFLLSPNMTQMPCVLVFFRSSPPTTQYFSCILSFSLLLAFMQLYYIAHACCLLYVFNYLGLSNKLDNLPPSFVTFITTIILLFIIRNLAEHTCLIGSERLK